MKRTLVSGAFGGSVVLFALSVAVADPHGYAWWRVLLVAWWPGLLVAGFAWTYPGWTTKR